MYRASPHCNALQASLIAAVVLAQAFEQNVLGPLARTRCASCTLHCSARSRARRFLEAATGWSAASQWPKEDARRPRVAEVARAPARRQQPRARGLHASRHCQAPAARKPRHHRRREVVGAEVGYVVAKGAPDVHVGVGEGAEFGARDLRCHAADADHFFC